MNGNLMAKAAGIAMSECRLLEENGRRHFMTRRFDRLAGGEKLHMQSLCALKGAREVSAIESFTNNFWMHPQQRGKTNFSVATGSNFMHLLFGKPSGLTETILVAAISDERVSLFSASLLPLRSPVQL